VSLIHLLATTGHRLTWPLKIVMCLLILSNTSLADKLVIPPEYVIKYSAKMAYKDFPKQADILAIIRVESAFNPKAFNPEKSKINPNRKIPPSIGLMQVQNGTFNPKHNMKQGTSLLREYYVKYCNRSIECAVKSYNIGPRNFKHGKLKKSGAIYFNKYQYHRARYDKFVEKLTTHVN